jgi:cytoskeletal protein RodZ
MTNALEVLQQRRLEEIGQYLRQMRVERQLNLRRISYVTKLKLADLNALETGSLKELPPAPEVKDLIKLYADALNLNGQELATTFPIEKDEILLNQ